ncbi:glycosyltransferase [Polynucleobacter sp. UK-Mo-2m-Kol15]|uniref:glycosyltransferase n=1 Tax=Polynucleobacter sp. UK-Mo-2m-Kol15 TaxID=2576916 RepID=UPI001C0DC900|nr:glycosyltransferase [Polynucleobacter sp. UK-Mo-2m-Kol15]MBU3574773.1 glycosyltransferase [Polynucleobacter sp. UK-Mo-2m-Kol15]
MNILFATYPMAFHTPGGGEVQLQAYLKHLPVHGVNVELFNQWDPQFKRFDLVHFFSCVGGSVHFCNFVKQLGLPLVISSSLWITEDTKHLYPISEIAQQLSLADAVIANSNLECDSLASVLQLPREKFFTVLNGVDDEFYERVTPELFRIHFNISTQFVLNVGNIEPRKNQLNLIRAMKLVPDMKLVLIGHARDENYLNLCIEEGGNQVIYLGPLPHDSDLLKSAYSACTIFCLPSTLETPGLAALEAHAVGVPIAITEVGPTAEYFAESAKYLNPMDIDDIANKILEILNAGKKIPDNIDKFHKYSWGVIAGDLIPIYQSLLHK